MRTAGLLCVVLALGCNSGDANNDEECGPNGKMCMPGYTCNPVNHRCISNSDQPPGPDAAVDAPLAAADARLFDAPVDAPPPAPDAAVAALSILPTMQDFGPVTVGGMTDPVIFIVQSVGSLSTGAITVTLSDTTSYTVLGGSCMGATLIPGGTCTVRVRFNPTGSAGPRPATLVLGAPRTVAATATLSGSALSLATLTLTPASSDFGRVEIGTSATLPFTLKNIGQSPSGTVQVSVTSALGFGIATNGCTTSLGPGATCEIRVRFLPPVVGLARGELAVTDDKNNRYTAALQATGTATLTVVKSGGGTGTVTSAPTGISCGATCSAKFTVDTVTLSGTPDGTNQLRWSGGGCSGSGDCVVSLTKPTTVNAVFDTQPGELLIAPTGYDFGRVTMGGSAPPQQFIVTNDGGTASGALSVAISDPVTYVISGGTCEGVDLAPGGTCTLFIELIATGSAGIKPATLTVSGLDSGSTVALLSGTILTPAELSLSTSGLSFGNVDIDGSSDDSFTVTNVGESQSGTPSVNLSSPEFTIISNGCTSPLAGGASCSVGVRFAPTSVGGKSASVSVSASPGGGGSVSLSGTGTATVTVQVVGTGSGAVSSDPAGIYACSGTCSAAFSVSSVTLVASPSSTSDFISWSGGGCSGAGTCSVSTTSSQSVTATFDLQPAQLSIAPAANMFNDTIGGYQSTTRDFMVTNLGWQATGPISMSVNGDQFTIMSDGCAGKSLGGGGDLCTVSVAFTPTGQGARGATLTATANPGGNATSSLTGNATCQQWGAPCQYQTTVCCDQVPCTGAIGSTSGNCVYP